LQRLYWIDHLLANDPYLNALALAGKDRAEQLKRARTFAEEALKFEEDGRRGFVQCIGTAALISKIDEALGSAQQSQNN